MEALTDQREQLAIRAIALIEDGQVPLTQLSKEGKFRRGRLMASQKFWEEAKAKADGKVRTYSRDFGDSVFSNMSMSCPFPIKLRKPDGRWYLSVEHAYVTAKLRSYRDHPKGAILDGNVGRCNRLLSTVAMVDPTGAKKAAKALISERWNLAEWRGTGRDLNVIHDIMEAKFRGSLEAQRALLRTGHEYLVEATSDLRWGCGLTRRRNSTPYQLDLLANPPEYEGLNCQGLILMVIREKLRKGHAQLLQGPEQKVAAPRGNLPDDCRQRAMLRNTPFKTIEARPASWLNWPFVPAKNQHFDQNENKNSRECRRRHASGSQAEGVRRGDSGRR